MELKDKVTQAIYDVVTDMNLELPDNLKLTQSPETVLFGQNGGLDSLGLVSFVVASEQKILEVFGKPISISDERAMSQRNSPFRTISTLVDYVEGLLKEGENGG